MWRSAGMEPPPATPTHEACMSCFRRWLAEVRRRLFAGEEGRAPVVRLGERVPSAPISAFERRKLRGDFQY